MADPLTWKEGEGYDIHVLRGGPSSKALTESLNLDPVGLSPFFEPHFKGAPKNHGVAVNTPWLWRNLPFLPDPGSTAQFTYSTLFSYVNWR
jgi:hypothetical protein